MEHCTKLKLLIQTHFKLKIQDNLENILETEQLKMLKFL